MSETDINTGNPDGKTALVQAVEKGNQAIIVNKLTYVSGHTDIFKELVSWSSWKECTPLIWATCKGDTVTAQL